MDERLRTLRRCYALERTPEAAMAWADAELRAAGERPPPTWTQLEGSRDPRLAALARRCRPAVRAAASRYFRGAPWARADDPGRAPLDELARLTRPHWLALAGVGERTVARLAELLAANALELRDGCPALALLDLARGRLDERVA
ncbi:MAG: hypothetical protein AB7N76_29870 [Planctomycetota bacterium]